MRHLGGPALLCTACFLIVSGNAIQLVELSEIGACRYVGTRGTFSLTSKFGDEGDVHEHKQT